MPAKAVMALRVGIGRMGAGAVAKRYKFDHRQLYHALLETGFIVGAKQWDLATDEDRAAVAELAESLERRQCPE
jgi:hypothetical protein